MLEDIYPPINDRTTEQLIEMIETSERWRDDVLKEASKELVTRGISIEDQALRFKSRKQREANYKRRTSKIKASAEYTTKEKVLIVLFGPFLILVLNDFTLFHSGKGYKLKNRQGWFYLIIGIISWFIMGYTYFKLIH